MSISPIFDRLSKMIEKKSETDGLSVNNVRLAGMQSNCYILESIALEQQARGFSVGVDRDNNIITVTLYIRGGMEAGEYMPGFFEILDRTSSVSIRGSKGGEYVIIKFTFFSVFNEP